MVKNYFKLVVALIFATNVMAQNIPSYVPTNGLVGWWPFNGNANDESGNGNHGTVNGATLAADRNGIANSAYSFDGIDDYVNCGNKNNLSLDNFSISIWSLLNPNTNWSKGRFLIYKGCDNIISQNGYSYRVYYHEPYGLTTDRFSKNRQLLDNNFINLFSQWNSIIFTFSGNKMKVYYNGEKIDSITSIGNTSINSENLLIGCRNITINNKCELNDFFKGQLDDIAIYNRALSDQEVKQLYEGCTKETATSSSFNSYVFTTNTPVNLTANPTGGTFNGEAVANNAFEPSKAKLGKNQVKYNFKNSTGCADSTNFTMILVDTLGNKCKETIYDTILKINFKLTTGIKAGQQTSMNVYPNPATDVLIIEANDIQALSGYKYKIVDLQGKEVYNALATAAKTEISLKSIGAKGMYILHIVDEKGVSIENKKIVLE